MADDALGSTEIRTGARADYLRLFLASFAVLFLELALIRWIPAYLRAFGFFTNFVLLASLLGGGVGILVHRGARIPLPPHAVALAVLVGFVIRERYSLRIASTDMLFYGVGDAGSDNFGAIPVVFVLVALAFVPLGRELGRLFAVLPPLRAYATDIAGSLAGIAVFAVLAFISLPPWVWFAVFAAVSWPVAARGKSYARLASAACLLVTLAVAAWYGGPGVWRDTDRTVWSPYYRIDYYPNSTSDGFIVSVNNIGHQEIRPVAAKEPFYFQAYRRLEGPPPRDVLIIGAGTGSDVAIALANGAGHVDAVEIDPALARIGAALHPAHPYQDPRVSLHIDDGRAFLRHTDKTYDLIIYALTDSLTLTSSQANLRLESFLYTTQSMADARAHLTADGAVVLYNFYRQDWSVRKLAGMVAAAFGEPPYVVVYGAWGRAAVVMAGPRLARLAAGQDHPFQSETVLPGTPGLPEIGAGRLGSDPALVLPSDDWPLFYLRAPGLPSLYAYGIAMVIAVALALVLGLTPAGRLRRFDWHFFLLGAAFMALETRSLVTFSLLFGTTWVVNALVFFAILASVLLAIGVNARFRFRRAGWLYLVLFALLAANFLLPTGRLLDVGAGGARYVLASALTFAPVFVANLIFSRSFRDSREADAAFASNLIGIMAGGLIEYGALAFGYQALLIAVAACYLGAMGLRQRAASP